MSQKSAPQHFAFGIAAPLVRLAIIFFAISVIFVVFKPLFMLANWSIFGEVNASGWWQAMLHGLPMDLCVGAYLSVIPALLILTRLWIKRSWPLKIAGAYCAVIALVVAAITVIDAALYPYWGFRLDMTPVFYFATSPSAVMGGLSAAQLLGGTAAWIVMWIALFFAYFFIILSQLRVIKASALKGSKRAWATVVAVLAMAALFVPIRGGFTVSTMNPSRAYFSDDQRLNHAALNPAFSLLYSATHQHHQSRQFQFMSPEEAAEAVALLNDRYFGSDPAITDSLPASSAIGLLSVDRPDIVVVILESFSAHLFPSLGGEAIAVRLDSIAADGLSFSNFYANSFRTDRALASILASFPAMPTASVMKRVEKIERLDFWTRRLRQIGYDAAYYYGGDVNFTNMKALLVSAGFTNIVCDKDFPLSQRLGKWGAHDDVLLQRVASDELTLPSSPSPRLVVVQTSSSHEPFEVPFSKLDHPAANAFAFTDSVVGGFVDQLRQSPRWPRTLLVLVADHYGCYPEGLTGPADRHHIPLIFSGGALLSRGVVDTYGTQVDLGAILLGALGEAPTGYGHDLLATDRGGYAFFTDPELATILTPSGSMVHNLQSGAVLGDSTLLHPARATLQTIYTDYDN